MLKVWACPEVVDVDLDIPEEGGLSISDLDIVTVWLCPDAVVDMNMCEFDEFEGPAGELELEQPIPMNKARSAKAPSHIACLIVMLFSSS